jgi:hypothetical protein
MKGEAFSCSELFTEGAEAISGPGALIAAGSGLVADEADEQGAREFSGR